MGIFDFLRGRSRGEQQPSAPTGPVSSAEQPSEEAPTRGRCSCPEHVEDLLDVTLPLSPEIAAEYGDEAMTVGELIDAQALGVRRTEPAERWVDALDEHGRVDPTRQDGPFHWTVWVGDEARSHYDDEAELELDASLEAQPGVEKVFWEDREILHVSVEGLCDSGALAATVRALADPRVRLG